MSAADYLAIEHDERRRNALQLLAHMRRARPLIDANLIVLDSPAAPSRPAGNPAAPPCAAPAAVGESTLNATRADWRGLIGCAIAIDAAVCVVALVSILIGGHG